MKKGIVIGTALAAAVLIYAGVTATIVPQGQEATLTGEVEFDPTMVATDFWEQKSAAYFEKNAVDLVTLIKKIGGRFFQGSLRIRTLFHGRQGRAFIYRQRIRARHHG